MLEPNVIATMLRNQRVQKPNLFSTPTVLDAPYGVTVRLTAPLPHAAEVQIGCRSLAPGTFEQHYIIAHTFTENSDREVTLAHHSGSPCEWIATYVGQTLPPALDVTFTAAEEPVPVPAPPSIEERIAALEREA